MPPVLVIQLARFGDLIQTKRLVKSLERDGADVHLLVDHSLAALARLVYPQATVHGIAAHQTSGEGCSPAGEAQAVFKALRGLNFSQVYNCNFAGLSLAVTRLFDPAVVRGHFMDGPQTHADGVTRLGFSLTRRREAATFNLVDLWGSLHANPIAPAAVNPAATPKCGGLGVVMAGRHARRSLPVKILAKAVQAALARTTAKRIFLLGTAAESQAAVEMVRYLPPAMAKLVDDRCGKTTWVELLDTVAGLDLVLTPDTGTMHLAAHLGTPVFATFLSSASCHETGPYGEGHFVWQTNAECAPCLECAPCTRGVSCLGAFDSPDFLRALGGNERREVPGLTTYASVCDDLGTAFVPVAGEDPHRPSRDRVRKFLQSHLALADAFDSDFAHNFYHERDWMLPARPDTTWL